MSDQSRDQTTVSGIPSLPLTYILDDNHVPVPCPNMPTWGAWCFGPNARDNRCVGYTEVIAGSAVVQVSTAFNGCSPRGRLFETLVGPGASDSIGAVVETYTSWDDAVAGHNRWVREVTP